ncbi:hypothetical protein [uncultured Megasphaera sp.]|uniref:hypothetical protein n=1 Tax=uncultured Megasphaera sp. TaxID=165188 RepID=UPI0026589120|nr:hypothetical protein [uncultured Megasphaera sp.]
MIKAGPVNLVSVSKYKWLIFLAAVILQLSALAYVGWRWHNIGVDGIPYQWHCLPRLEVSSFGTDYVRVVFPEDTTAWLDTGTVPEANEPIYVYISHDDKGMIQIQGASAEKPGIGQDYMDARVVSYDGSAVQFQVDFGRYRIAPELADGIYNINSTDNVIASIRMKKGEGVIEGIFINGIPLEECSNGAAMEAARKSQESAASRSDQTFNTPRIIESGMVPPKEE